MEHDAMKIHRFYVGDVADKSGKLKLTHNLWVNNETLIKQWLSVLHFKLGEKLILFNQLEERLYVIEEIEYPRSVRLKYINDINKKIPKKHLILFWPLLKNDKNYYVLRKATELGVREFIPLITKYSKNLKFDIEKANLTVKEAAENCGRFDIPIVKEPMPINQAIKEFKDVKLYVCEDGYQDDLKLLDDKFGVFVGPESGWSKEEKDIFEVNKIEYFNLSNFTLNAETASVVATAKLLQ